MDSASVFATVAVCAAVIAMIAMEDVHVPALSNFPADRSFNQIGQNNLQRPRSCDRRHVTGRSLAGCRLETICRNSARLPLCGWPVFPTRADGIRRSTPTLMSTSRLSAVA